MPTSLKTLLQINKTFAGEYFGMSPDYYMGQVGGKTKEQYRQDLGTGLKQGLKDGIKGGLINYGLNALLDNTSLVENFKETILI